MATTRLLLRPSSVTRSSSSSQTFSTTAMVKSTSMKSGFKLSENRLTGEVERKPVTMVKAIGNVLASPMHTKKVVVDLELLLAIIKSVALRGLRVITRPKLRKFQVQMFIEKVIIDCRFFTMLAVAGSLLGSILCFIEGCFLVLESYVQYFHALSTKSDQGHIVQLVIESIDMFLVGTALLIFGMGLHVMFVGARAKAAPLPSSNLFGLYHLKELPSWAAMKSITQAKSKIGHALMMLLQVGILEKFKSIPLVTGLDLACFAGAIFVSSAGLFILSRLSVGHTS